MGPVLKARDHGRSGKNTFISLYSTFVSAGSNCLFRDRRPPQWNFSQVGSKGSWGEGPRQPDPDGPERGRTGGEKMGESSDESVSFPDLFPPVVPGGSNSRDGEGE